MNVSTLIKQYFNTYGLGVTIDVFDENNIYSVYQHIMNMLTRHITIETTLLQALNYCFYEILDNVLTHSGKKDGIVITYYDTEHHTLSLLVADDGQGIHASLTKNEQYAMLSEVEALKICVQDSVTDGKGMGFGLYTASLLFQNVGLRFEIQSGNHTLRMEGDTTTIIDKTTWQGTVVYMHMQTDKEIEPSKVVANRTNVADQYNETFLTDKELEELW